MKIKDIINKHFQQVHIIGKGQFSLNTKDCINEIEEKFKTYIKTELLKAFTAEKEFDGNNKKDRPAYCYLQGIESALISLDEEFNFGINEELSC